MKSILNTSRTVPIQRKNKLAKSWFFRLSSLAFIAMFTPLLAVSFGGFALFFLVLVPAIVTGILENSFSHVINSIVKGIIYNKLLFLFMIWYVAGFILNVFLLGKGFTDWRYLMNPIFLLLALFFAFAFMNNDRCNRYFQLGFIIIAGVQSFYSTRVLYLTPDIARKMWNATSGAWIYGNQIVFATYAVIIPLLLWRSFTESRLMKLILLLSCVLIIITSLISSFATPLALILLGAATVMVLSILFLRRSSKLVLLLAVVIPITILQGYKYTRDNPLFTSSILRIENFIKSPESGGYLGIRGAVSRWDLARISIDTFQRAPFFGAGGPREHNLYIGGHSSLFDSLAIFGLLGGGGALCGIFLVLLVNSTRQFWHKRNWETLMALTLILLLVVAGIADPYWEGILPIVIILTHPFHRAYSQEEMSTVQIKPNRLKRVKSA